jgi:ligand-binding sensor domain-containing protein/serine phosphatase RsbU (regulator of sigma subunit)
MRIFPTLRYFCFTVVFFLFYCLTAKGQDFSYKDYGTEYGIPSGFVYTINQSDDGLLWIGTGNGLARFDGYNYYKVQYPDSVETRNPSASIRDNTGSIWIGCSDGSVFRADCNRILSVPVGNSRSISSILLGPDSMIYVIPQGKTIYKVNPRKPSEYIKLGISEEYSIFSAAFTKSGDLLLGTQGSVLHCSVGTDTLIVKNEIEQFDYSVVSAISATSDESTFIAGTEGNGLYLIKITVNNTSVKRFNGHPEWESLEVKSIFANADNDYLISTFGAGVIKFHLDGENVASVQFYNSKTGLSSDDVQLVFRDLEENYWFGLFGNGLTMLSSNAFTHYFPGKNSQENNVIFVGKMNGSLLLGAPTGFHVFDQKSGKSLSFTGLTSAIGGAQILCYHIDNQDVMWIGTDGKGLFMRGNDGKIRSGYRSGDTGADKINDIETDDNYIWLATTNGVIVLNKQTRSLKAKFDMSNGLPHNSIKKITLRNGNAYIATESDRLYVVDKDLNINAGNCAMNGSTINKVYALAIDAQGVIWSATNGNGVFACSGDSVYPLNRVNGLMSNYCYSILADSHNNLWIGHQKGFSRYNKDTEVMRTFGADYAKGGTCNVNGMYESADGKIFMGTTEGMVMYDPAMDSKKELPPFNNVTSVIINDIEYPYQPVIVLPYNKYRIIVNYSGVNFSDPDNVYYSTFMENFDNDWSKMSANRSAYYSLSDGKYVFNLVSVDENGKSQEKAKALTIIISKPIFKKWWFILLMTTLLMGVILFIMRQREKAQAKIREYLENELELRTSVVVKQKGEIELQNIEITDSINYAKRIQSSILPDINKLRDTFSEAFILFHPRDIVSGDFYWFDRIDDDKFIVVCADSTGHGVPGAFMSMIGSTLLQDIVTRQKITTPSKVLSLLDEHIFSTLNQNVEVGVSNDGMDMVICEFNIKTRQMRFASAMRPIIIVMSGEPYYIKGNRSSVGGESVIEKYYDDQEYYLNEGDSIYLFSDGLPDQFGGADGRKMKIARLKKIIEEISGLPMREQEKAISDFFFEWKGDYEQVDDILLMGIRV